MQGQTIHVLQYLKGSKKPYAQEKQEDITFIFGLFPGDFIVDLKKDEKDPIFPTAYLELIYLLHEAAPLWKGSQDSQ